MFGLSMDGTAALDNGNNGAARWTLRLFGGFELGELPSGKHLVLPGKRERVLLAALALSPKSSQPRGKLATLLWGDGDDESALDNLRTTVWRLRKTLGDKQHRIVASSGEEILLDCTAFQVDALEFRRLASSSGVRELERAANLYAGELLHGLDIGSEEFESWRRGEAARCRDQAVDVLARLMTQLDASGETERAIETGMRIIALEPLEEATIRGLMRLYGRSGRRGAAVRLYRTFADVLRADLDAQPESETRAVYAEIARGGEESASPPAAAPLFKTPKPAMAAHSQDAPREPDASRVLAQPAVRTAWKSALGKATARPFRIVAAGGLATALLIVAATQYAAPLGAINGQPPENGAARPVSTTLAKPISIAVLPFSNLSGDLGQEYLSDGITEEITSALAKVADLHVVARTSAYQFKGENRDIRSIGRQLNASHLIEGSVRRDGGRLRITAQLVEASGGTHLWSETYNRQISDIFAIQEDIARTIAASLRVPLGLEHGRNFIANSNIDPESYQQFLRAKQLVRARTRGAAQAVEILEPLVARYADFAPAWVQLSRAYAATIVANENAPAEDFRRITAEYSLKRSAAARRAVELEPDSAEAYWALAVSHVSPESLQLREELLSKALALDPNDADILTSYGQLLLRVGRVKAALPIMQQVVALEPFVPVYTGNLGEALWVNGQNEAALRVLEAGPRGNSRGTELARVYASMGRYGDAADKILESSKTIYPPELLAEASRLLRMAPAKSVAPQSLPRLGTLGFVYLYVGAPMRALEFHEELAEAGGGGGTSLLWHSSYAPLRKTERFKTLMRNAGLVDYWRARGWPDLCRPMDTDDFVCD